MVTAPSIIGDLAVETDGLVKTFGATRAVNSVNLTIPRGSLYGVLGPSAAGTGMALQAGGWLSIGAAPFSGRPGQTSGALGLVLAGGGTALLVPAVTAP